MTILTILIVSYILMSISLFFLFPKAGVDGWKGLVPGLNFIEWCKIVGRPSWWAALLLFPIVNFFIYAGLCVDMVRSFGKFGFGSSALAVALTPFSFFPLAFSDSKYNGPILKEENEYINKIKEATEAGNRAEVLKLNRGNKYAKTWGREWIESIVFAVFAAAFIRMFLIEAYVIPTPSMEGSLLVGDFLFVSKAHYGIRTPQTVAMLPLLHNRVPIVGGESYWEKPSLPYYRLPAIETIDNNDPIVFNWPVGDSVYVTAKRPYSVFQAENNPGFTQGRGKDSELIQKIRSKDFITRPIDKKDHYIKRCIAKAGDTLHIRNKQVYINGTKAKNPKEMQFLYRIANLSTISKRKLEEHNIVGDDVAAGYGLFLTDIQHTALKSEFPNLKMEPQPNQADPKKLFPHDAKHFPRWSVDNYGPIWIPKAGETVDLSPSNIALYRKVIKDYEHNDYEEKGGMIFINGKKATSYTFKQDYFWAMGDNRHNSEDSRSWGFVPHDHIVGKPLFIWFSTKNGSIFEGIRWKRIFSGADKFE